MVQKKPLKKLVLYIDFMKSVDEMGAYSNLYQPFITAFATLGDEGVKIATTLSNELATKMSLAEAKGNVQLRNMEYKSLVENFNWTRAQHEAWSKDDALKRDSMNAADYILSSSVFDMIEGGDITTASGERLKKHNVAIKTVIEDAFNHFEGKMSKGAITAGLKLAMDNAGKSFAFNDIAMLSKGLGQNITSMEMGGYMSLLRGWSSDWINMNPQLRQAVKTYIQDGTLPDEEMVKTGQAPDIDLIKKMAQTYSPTGDYMNYYSLISTIPGFNALYKDENGLTLPTMQGTEDIIRPFGGYGFVKGQYNYNPYERIQILNQLKNKAGEITSGNLWDASYRSEIMSPEEYKTLINPEEYNNKGKLPKNAFLK